MTDLRFTVTSFDGDSFTVDKMVELDYNKEVGSFSLVCETDGDSSQKYKIHFPAKIERMLRQIREFEGGETP